MKLKKIINTLSKDEVISEYLKYKTLREFGKAYDVSQQTITRLMDHYGVQRTKPNNGNKKHYFNECYFKAIDSEEKAYWLGFIYADGCVYKGTGCSLRLQINLKYDDISHLRRFQKAIGSDYTIQVKDIDKYKVALLKINSTKMCKDLINLGVVEKKSLVCSFPSISEEYYSHFIRGLFDGDGCVSATISDNFKKNVEIVGSVNLISRVAEILNLKYYNSNGREYLLVVRASSNKDILRMHEFLYKDARVYLQRKKKVYDILVYVLKSPLVK